MSRVVKIKKMLNKKGFSGPIFVTNKNNIVKFDPDDGNPIVLTNRAGVPKTGFYVVKANVNDVNFSAEIKILGYLSKKNFLIDTGSPEIEFTCFVDDTDEVVDSNNVIITPGVFSQYFAKDIVKTNGNCEQWKAIDFVLALTGTSKFQQNFPVSFASDKGFSAEGNDGKITQTNIDNAIAALG